MFAGIEFDDSRDVMPRSGRSALNVVTGRSLAAHPRSIARDTSPGTPQIAVPRRIQRGGG